MSGFSSEWLALREPADTAARSSRLVRLVDEALRERTVIRAVDLGSGTGSNVRYIAGRLSTSQDWLLVDDDPALVAEASRRFPTAIVREVHLAAAIDAADAGVFAGRSLVTASALLDLVSANWLHSLATRTRDAGAVALFALTYDGNIQCDPGDSDDETIRSLVNEHQRRDKGFGPALGPEAADVAERCFADLGYHVERDSTPWVLTGEDAELQRQLIAGWAEAAAEMAPDRRASIDRWRTRRLAHVETGGSRLTVGHADIAAWLPPSG